MSASAFYTQRVFQVRSLSYIFSGNMTMMLIINGEGKLDFHGKTVFLRKGSFIFFPEYTLFSLSSSEGLQVFEIQILPGFFKTFCPDSQSLSFRNFYISESSDDKRSVEIFRKLADFILTAPFDKDNLMEKTIALGELYLSLRRFYISSEKLSEYNDDYVHERIRNILDYISDNYSRRITVKDISRSLGLNPQYFGTFFTSHFHKSFVDFLNEFRVSKSMDALCNTTQTLTKIALDSGFQTYRSYSNAFHRIYETNPSQYRSLHSAGTGSSVTDQSAASDLSFLKKYLRRTVSEVSAVPSQEISIELNLQHSQALAADTRLHAVSIGSGYQLLQENVYKQLKKAAGECHFTHVHFRDLFSDLLSVYTEPVPNHPMFTWDYVDDIINRILHLGLHPYIELGFMPRELAATRETLGFGYHPCIGAPKSLDLWGQMIRSFLSHSLEKYGSDEMKHWRFDFWNTANIHSSDGFWNASADEFFELYRTTYLAFRELAPELKLGTPNYSIPDGYSWYRDFLEKCRSNNMHPDFLSLHLYSCEDDLRNFEGIFPQTPNYYNYLPLIHPDLIINTLMHLKDLLASCGFADLPILAGEWNISYYLLDLVRDTAFMATYTVQTWLQTISLLDGLTYCNLSDISEQSRPSTLPFPGAQGLISRSGLTKPAYNALFMLHKLDKNILYQDSRCVITRSRNTWHILLFHICDYENFSGKEASFLSEDYRYQVFKDTGNLEFSGKFKAFPGIYRITTYQIDRDHGCAYDAWLKMGSPNPLTSEISQALLHASYPMLHFEQVTVSEELRINAVLKPHTVILYEIRTV